MDLKTKIFNDFLVVGIVATTVICWGGVIYLIASLISPLTWVESLTLGGIGVLLYVPLRANLKKAVGE